MQYIYIYIYTHIAYYTYIERDTHMLNYNTINLRMYTYMYNVYAYVYYICIVYMYMYTYAYVYVCICVCISYYVILYFVILYYIIRVCVCSLRTRGAPSFRQRGAASSWRRQPQRDYIHIYIYIYIYIYIHTQIHIYIYISFMGTFSRRKGKCSKGMALAFILRGRALHWLSFSEQGEVLLRGVGTPRYLSIRGENSAGRESVCALAAR